jgi:hypothetical protein
MAISGLKNLCTPAYVYLVISMISIFIILLQNSGNSNTYCMGNYSCQVSSLFLVFVVKLIYVLFWTWILNLICNAGAPGLSWFLVLFPYVLMFVLIGLLFVGTTDDVPQVVANMSMY